MVFTSRLIPQILAFRVSLCGCGRPFEVVSADYKHNKNYSLKTTDF